MNRCDCGSYAINRANQWSGSKLDKCDICFWKDEAFRARDEVNHLRAERRWMLENSEHAKEMQRLLTEFGFTKNHIGDATEKEDK